jgi:hypothetical protein
MATWFSQGLSPRMVEGSNLARPSGLTRGAPRQRWLSLDRLPGRCRCGDGAWDKREHDSSKACSRSADVEFSPRDSQPVRGNTACLGSAREPCQLLSSWRLGVHSSYDNYAMGNPWRCCLPSWIRHDYRHRYVSSSDLGQVVGRSAPSRDTKTTWSDAGRASGRVGGGTTGWRQA